jgi:hypothetical protein
MSIRSNAPTPQAFPVVLTETPEQELARITQEIFDYSNDVAIAQRGRLPSYVDQRLCLAQFLESRQKLLRNRQERLRVLMCDHRRHFHWSCITCATSEGSLQTGTPPHQCEMKCYGCPKRYRLNCRATARFSKELLARLDAERQAHRACVSSGAVHIVQSWRWEAGVPVPVRCCLGCGQAHEIFWGIVGADMPEQYPPEVIVRHDEPKFTALFAEVQL